MRSFGDPTSSTGDRKQTFSAKSDQVTLTIEPGAVCRFDIQPTNSRHQHNYYEVVIITAGSGEYQLEDMTFPLSRGDVFVSPPNRLHEIRSFKTRDLELFFVMFGTQSVASSASGAEVDSAFAEFGRAGNTWSSGGERLLPYVDLICSTASNSVRLELSRLFATEALRLLTAPSPSRLGDHQQPSDIQTALAVIETRATTSLSVSEVARLVNLSERTLRRRFAQHVGHGVAEEIRHRRMRIAAHHLLMGYNVTEVASRVGIPDVSQFARAFRAEMQVTPKQFQRTYTPGNLRRVTEFEGN